MKFARYLEDASVPEWRRSYVNYAGLKKLIARVVEHRTLRLSHILAKTNSNVSNRHHTTHVLGSAQNALRRRLSSSASSSAISRSQVPSYGAAESAPPAQASPSHALDLEAGAHQIEPVSLVGTGLDISGDHTAPFHSATEPVLEPHGQPNGSGPVEGQDISDDNEVRHARFEPSVLDQEDHLVSEQRTADVGGSTSVARPAFLASHSASGKNLRTRSAQAAVQLVGRLKNKTPPSYPTTLNQIIEENFDEEEAKIFLALDSEITRVIAFLEAREKQALERFEVLAWQLQELAHHRLEFKAKAQGPAGARRNVAEAVNLSAVGSRLSKLASGLPARVMPIDGKRTSLDTGKDRRGSATSAQPVLSDTAQPGYWDEGAERRSQALSRIPHFTTAKVLTPADEEIRRANEAAALSHDPERYRSAKKKMKAAVLEEYRLLELIKDFRTLNRTALAKALKKLQKKSGVHVSEAFYKARVAPTMLVKSDRIERLLKSTEELYTFFFEHGDRKKARERLRGSNAFATLGSTTPHQSHHISVFKAGIFLGVALCSTVGGLIHAQQEQTKREIPQWAGLLRVYGVLFIPALFALLFGLNLAAWRRTRVNYVFIFEFDVRTMADYHQYFETPALFLLLLSLCFWVSFLNPFPDKIAPTTWPMVWIVIVVLFMLMPLRLFLFPSRRWFVKSLLRVLQAGVLSRVEFRDFFLGDELNSLVYTFGNLWYIGCQYDRHWPAPDTCNPNHTFWTPALSALPPLIRFIQCWRRWYDSDMKGSIHLINAGKYTSSILNIWFYYNWRYHGANRTVDLVLWCLFGTIYSIYTSSWDLCIDWGLMNPRARWPFLRDELYYEWPILYYFAMVTNVIIRSSWVIYLLPGPALTPLRAFIIALLEMLRRWQWNMYRLENEHLGNADDFRVVKDVPLPYTHGVRVSEEDLDDEEDLTSTKRRNVFKLSETRAPRAFDENSDPFASDRGDPVGTLNTAERAESSSNSLGPGHSTPP
ncbi:Xenotropic and polytropic retrovirus receptor 1 [Tilletia horrida]|nr:Xenotropic and polytropic retrovirus receptor 1 [Tilletia horrida]